VQFEPRNGEHPVGAGGSPAAAAMFAQRPNDARVRGAGPSRKAFLRLKGCKGPHPLQPIVRPRYCRDGHRWREQEVLVAAAPMNNKCTAMLEDPREIDRERYGSRASPTPMMYP
jgi:hypothetical protein